MKKRILALIMLALFSVSGIVFAAPVANDVPRDHWAYPAVTELARVGIIDGYQDGTFRGDKTMSRYEMAQIVEKAVNNQEKATAVQKALIDKLAIEFALELNKIETRVAKVEKKTNVWLGGETRTRYFTNSPKTPGSTKLKGGDSFDFRQRINFWGNIDETKTFAGRLTTSTVNRLGNTDSPTGGSNIYLDIMNVTAKDMFGFDRVRLGRSALDTLGLGMFGTASSADGITLNKKIGDVDFTGWTGLFRSAAGTGVLTAGTKDETNQITTAQLGFKPAKNLNVRTGYYWSDAADSSGAVDGTGPRLNTRAGMAYNSSTGWLVSADYKIGAVTLMADYMGTSLSGASGGLPDNPKGWMVQVSNKTGPTMFYGAVPLVNPAKVNTGAWMVQYRSIDAGTLPAAALATSSLAYNQPYSVLTHGYDNVKALFLAYQHVVAKNTVVALEWQDLKIKNRGLTTLSGDDLDKTFLMKLEFFY